MARVNAIIKCDLCGFSISQDRYGDYISIENKPDGGINYMVVFEQGWSCIREATEKNKVYACPACSSICRAGEKANETIYCNKKQVLKKYLELIGESNG